MKFRTSRRLSVLIRLFSSTQAQVLCLIVVKVVVVIMQLIDIGVRVCWCHSQLERIRDVECGGSVVAEYITGVLKVGGPTDLIGVDHRWMPLFADVLLILPMLESTCLSLLGCKY